jgi:two-component system NarL family response regulator
MVDGMPADRISSHVFDFFQDYFDWVPAISRTFTRGMNEAVFVFDARQRLVDLNPAAAEILHPGTPASAPGLIGQPAQDVLEAWPSLLETMEMPETSLVELGLDDGPAQRSFSVRCSPLMNRRGQPAGCILLLHEVTRLKQAQQALAQAEIARERERMADELHDNLGQMLSYLALNAQAIREQVEQGNYAAVMGQLDALSQAAQNANQDIREFILDVKTEVEQERNFSAVLQQYLERYTAITGLRTRLSLPEESIDPLLPQAAFLNLLRIIQEALANARKYAQATLVHIIITLTPEHLVAAILDDGVGFDFSAGGGGFGLDIMRQRAERAGAGFEIRSSLQQGTQVIVKFVRPHPDTVGEQLTGVTAVLVDDHPLFVEGIKSLLEAHGMTISGVAPDAQEAVHLAGELKPDLLMLDVHMPRGRGPQAVKPIKDISPSTQVVMLSMTAEDEDLVEAFNQGASGYLLKSQPPEELIRALAALRRGETPLAPGLANRLAALHAHPETAWSSPERQELQAVGLSGLQVEILEYVAQGWTYREIAAYYHLSESAIKYHFDRIQTLLKVNSRREVIAYAFRHGLVKNRRGQKPPD